MQMICGFLIDQNGSMIHMTEYASLLLQKYYPSVMNDETHLPLEVQEWIANIRSNLTIETCSMNPVQTLIKHFGNHTLNGKVYVDPINYDYLILLNEQTPVNLNIELLKSFNLTTKEAEVLFWIMHDKSNAEIADQLNCSQRTIQKHCENIFSKFAVDSRIAAITYIFEKMGLVSLGQKHHQQNENQR